MWECKSRASVVVVAALFTAAARADADAPRLELVWADPLGMAAGAYPALAAESRAVLASIGADVAWREAPSEAVVGPGSLVVIAVPTYPSGQGRERHVMGATRTVADGAALAVWVFPDQVAWALGLDLGRRPSWSAPAEANFARALARVASHEIVHALGAFRHTRRGLMASRLDRRALVAPALPIDGATLAIVRRTFDRGARASSGSWTPSLPPAPLAAGPDLMAAPGPGR